MAPEGGRESKLGQGSGPYMAQQERQRRGEQGRGEGRWGVCQFIEKTGVGAPEGPLGILTQAICGLSFY